MPPAVRKIQAAAVELFNVSREDLLGPKRSRLLRNARAYAMQRVRSEIVVNHLPPSYPQIGRWFGKHHTAVLYLCDTRIRDARLARWMRSSRRPSTAVDKACGPLVGDCISSLPPHPQAVT